MRFSEALEGQIHAVDCVDFMRSLEPHWADAIITGPSANEQGKWVKRERRWMVNFARALRFGGVLALLGRPGWCSRQERAVRRVGFNVLGICGTPESSFSGKEVLVAVLGSQVEVRQPPNPWKMVCSRVQWGSSVPVEQVVAIVEEYTKPGELVFDPFMGLGTTAMACERTGRRWVGCEIEAGRAQDATRRIEAIR